MITNNVSYFTNQKKKEFFMFFKTAKDGQKFVHYFQDFPNCKREWLYFPSQKKNYINFSSALYCVLSFLFKAFIRLTFCRVNYEKVNYQNTSLYFITYLPTLLPLLFFVYIGYDIKQRLK